MMGKLFRKVAYNIFILFSVATVVFFLFSFSFPSPEDILATDRTDQKTIDALNNLKKESVVSLLNETVSPKTRRMVNVLSFAENHENMSGAKTSFDDLVKWKDSRVYE